MELENFGKSGCNFQRFRYCWLMFFIFHTRCLVVRGFNVEAEKPSFARGSDGSMFGYSVAVIDQAPSITGSGITEKMLLVGAPNKMVMVGSMSVEGHGEVLSCSMDSNAAQKTIACTTLNTDDPNNLCKNLKYENSTCEMNMRMGSTIAVNRMYKQVMADSSTSLVTMCAPLWKNTYKEKSMGQHHMYGMCVKTKEDLKVLDCRNMELQNSFHPCWPFWPYKEELSFHQAAPYQAFAQAGMSAAYTQDGKNQIIGAPGVDVWRGAFMVGTQKYPTNPEPDKKRTTYLGYALVSGRFRNNLFKIAVGMPNYNNQEDGYTGRVYIFNDYVVRVTYVIDPGVPNKCDGLGIVEMSTFSSTQVGTKFGSALGVADVDGDGYDELFIGSPLYSSKYPDEGRVFIYTTTNDLLCGPIGVLSGSAAVPSQSYLANRARFGSSIASAGDLNIDSFQDVVIGAPYEDEGVGAIYIYNGNGRNFEPFPDRYSQRITGRFNGNNLRTFGWSIYGDEDVDGNGYPDLAVGAYRSDTVVVLRSRPIVEVLVTMTVNPKTIPLNASGLECSLDKFQLCTSVTALFQYSSSSVKQLVLSWEFKADTLHFEKEGYSRVNLRKSPGQSGDVDRFSLESDIAVVRNYTLDVELYKNKPEPKDAWTPVRVEGWIDLVNSSAENHSTLDPVLKDTVQRHVEAVAEFDKKCESLDKCTSDIQTDVKMFLRRRGTPQPVERDTVLYVDSANELQMTVELTNLNNTAYRANFTAVVEATIKGDIETLHGDVGASCSHAIVRRSTEINCTADFKLGRNEKVKVTAFFDTSRPRLSQDKELKEMQTSIAVSVKASQANADENPDNNNFQMTIPVQLKYDLIVQQDEYTSDQFRFKSKVDSTVMIPLIHNYFIINNGPSFSPHTIVNISVPLKQGSSEIALIKGMSEKCWQPGSHVQTTPPSTSHQTTNVMPTIHSVNPEKRKRRDVTDTVASHLNATDAPSTVQVKGEKNVTCETYECVVIHCHVGALDSGSQEKVTLTLEVPEKELAREKDIRVIRYKTRADLTDPHVWHGGKVVPFDLSVFAEKVTTFRVEPGTVATKIEVWIIIVSVLGAILLLALVIGVLYKLGFFKRKKHVQVQQWKSESLYRRRSQMRMSSTTKSYTPLEGQDKPSEKGE